MAAHHEKDFLPFGLNSTPTFVLAIVAATLVFVVTLVKILVSRVRHLQFFLSDQLAVLGSLIFLASLGLIIYYNALPLPNNSPATSLDSADDGLRTAYLKAVFVVEILWPLALGCAKMSILLLFRRVFLSKNLRILVSCTMIFIVLLYTAMVLGTIFQCRPPQAFWHGNDHGNDPVCFNRQFFFIFSGIPNAIANAIILGLPVYEIRRLVIGKSVKIFLWSIFILGSFALGASIARFVEIARIGGPESRSSRVGGGAAVIVEASVVILCAYLPTLCPALWMMRPLRNMRHHRPSQLSWHRLLGMRDSNASRFTGGRLWPRARQRPYSEFIDPSKPLPREPDFDFMRSLGSFSTMPESSLGGIRVEETVTTTVQRRSQLFGPDEIPRVATGLGSWVIGPRTVV